MTADKQDKGKGKERAQDQPQDQDEGEGQMKEIRQRPPPLPAVKGTIGAIESPSRRSFYSSSPVSPSTTRGHHSSAPSYDYTNDPSSQSPRKAETQLDQHQQQLGQVLRRERPVFRVDPTMTSCFDRLKLEKKEEIRSLFGA